MRDQQPLGDPGPRSRVIPGEPAILNEAAAVPREADIGTGTDVARVRRALQAERDAALLYRRLAEKLHEPAWRALVERLATEEESHAAHWAAWLVEAGEPVPELRPSVRSRLLAGWLALSGSAQLPLPPLLSSA